MGKSRWPLLCEHVLALRFGGRERAIDSYSLIIISVGLQISKMEERLTCAIKSLMLTSKSLNVTLIFASYIRDEGNNFIEKKSLDNIIKILISKGLIIRSLFAFDRHKHEFHYYAAIINKLC